MIALPVVASVVGFGSELSFDFTPRSSSRNGGKQSLLFQDITYV
jgi:hypothetical protein